MANRYGFAAKLWWGDAAPRAYFSPTFTGEENTDPAFCSVTPSFWHFQLGLRSSEACQTTRTFPFDQSPESFVNEDRFSLQPSQGLSSGNQVIIQDDSTAHFESYWEGRGCVSPAPISNCSENLLRYVRSLGLLDDALDVGVEHQAVGLQRVRGGRDFCHVVVMG